MAVCKGGAQPPHVSIRSDDKYTPHHCTPEHAEKQGQGVGEERERTS